MAYPTISARRLRYDLDGTVVGYNTQGFAIGISSQLSAAAIQAMNSDASDQNKFTSNGMAYFYWIFAELKDIYYALVQVQSNNATYVQWSPDTTYGGDGTWTQIGTQVQTTDGASDWFRYPIQLGTPITGAKGIRMAINTGGWTNLWGVHLYGNKHSGQTPDDIVFYSDAACTTEITAVHDWGSVIAGSVPTYTMYLKNVSASKTINNLTIAVNGQQSGDGMVSIDGGTTFASTTTIASLAPGAVQEVIIQNTAPTSPPYGNREFYVQATIGSWS